MEKIIISVIVLVIMFALSVIIDLVKEYFRIRKTNKNVKQRQTILNRVRNNRT